MMWTTWATPEFIQFRGSESRITQILCRKRKAFAAESELRILYLDISGSVSWERYSDRMKWLLVPIRNFDWIDGIYYDPSLAEWFVAWAKAMVEPLGLKLHRSDAG
jgi:hypothetical protein